MGAALARMCQRRPDTEVSTDLVRLDTEPRHLRHGLEPPRAAGAFVLRDRDGLGARSHAFAVEGAVEVVHLVCDEAGVQSSRTLRIYLIAMSYQLSLAWRLCKLLRADRGYLLARRSAGAVAEASRQHARPVRATLKPCRKFSPRSDDDLCPARTMLIPARRLDDPGRLVPYNRDLG